MNNQLTDFISIPPYEVLHDELIERMRICIGLRKDVRNKLKNIEINK